MAEGRSNAAIGAAMGIGAKTVETHVNAIQMLDEPGNGISNRHHVMHLHPAPRSRT
jgi:DNA-binding CsgD family transcriptional regulator